MIQHFELLVEEPSMEAFLRGLLPRLLPPDRTFSIHTFQGKHDLLDKLEKRLRGYARWLPPDWRIVVVVDRDGDDCLILKQHLEQIAAKAGLTTRSSGSCSWQIVNRIVVEELEAWYFGDWEAVLAAYPNLPTTVPRQSRYCNPDAIAGGTWEALERILQRHGYFKGGIPKIQLAREIGQYLDPSRCRSPSFRCFYAVLREAVCTTGSST